jgi:hypothetical protein
MSSPPKKSDTDGASAGPASPAYDPKAAAKRERERKKQKTDFHTLKRELGPEDRRHQYRTATDYIIDGFTPFLIFLMVWAVVYFLLDVRYIYTEVHNMNLRIAAFCLIMGVVALNRLVAKDNSQDSPLYIAGLVMVTALYTLATSSMYGVGSFGGSFLDRPWIGTFFNIVVVSILWWVTNRLMHECSVDENRSAGDIGIVTGTLRNLRRSIARADAPKAKKSRKDDYLLPSIEITAYDPHEWKEEKSKAAPSPKSVERLSRRHPGMSIFYFAVPSIAIFALGLPVLLRGGDPFVLAGHFYVGLFTISALLLLLLTSMGGLREYFRSRRVYLPAGIGYFWAGLGLFMVLVVALGALQFPYPAMPAPAYIAGHEKDVWNKTSTFELKPIASTAAEQIQQSRVVERVSQVVMALLVLFGLYSALRGTTILAAEIGRNRDRYPAWVLRFFAWLDRVLERIVSLPEARSILRPGRPSAAAASSTKFRNPMAGEGPEGRPEDVRRYVAHSFDALCALGEDLGRPRRRDETPYEFLRHLPREMTPLKKEAGEIVELYVRSAYSLIPPDAAILDRLRKFWFEYERLRRRYIR